MSLILLLLASQGTPHEAKLTNAALNPSDEQVGSSVAISPERVVTGGGYPSAQNAAYLFERNGGVWGLPLQAGLGSLDSEYGSSVAVSGDRVLVGDPGYDGMGFDSCTGAIYAFEGGGSAWSVSQVRSERQPTPILLDRFGHALDVDGGTAVIGSDRQTATARGEAWAYLDGGGGTWTNQRRFFANDQTAGDHFGWSVGISGDTVVVGAWGNDDDGADSGSAYVFQRTGSLWAQQQKLTASDASSGDRFGFSAAISGEVLVVGAPSARVAAASTGKAYVFRRSGSTWTEEKILLASDAADGDAFGFDVDIDGDQVLVGAPQKADGGAESGCAYVFHRPGASWSEQQKLVASDLAALDRFGQAVAIRDGTAAVGSRSPPHGAVYVYRVESASVETRSGPPNPTSYTAARPVLGSTFSATVDLSTTGHTHALLYAFTEPRTQTLSGGQLLLVGGVQVGFLPGTGHPVASFSTTLPSDPTLAGTTFYTQALHQGGPVRFALSNSQDLTAGF